MEEKYGNDNGVQVELSFCLALQLWCALASGSMYSKH